MKCQCALLKLLYNWELAGRVNDWVRDKTIDMWGHSSLVEHSTAHAYWDAPVPSKIDCNHSTRIFFPVSIFRLFGHLLYNSFEKCAKQLSNLCNGSDWTESNRLCQNVTFLLDVWSRHYEPYGRRRKKNIMSNFKIIIPPLMFAINHHVEAIIKKKKKIASEQGK